MAVDVDERRSPALGDEVGGPTGSYPAHRDAVRHEAPAALPELERARPRSGEALVLTLLQRSKPTIDDGVDGHRPSVCHSAAQTGASSEPWPRRTAHPRARRPCASCRSRPGRPSGEPRERCRPGRSCSARVRQRPGRPVPGGARSREGPEPGHIVRLDRSPRAKPRDASRPRAQAGSRSRSRSPLRAELPDREDVAAPGRRSLRRRGVEGAACWPRTRPRPAVGARRSCCRARPRRRGVEAMTARIRAALTSVWTSLTGSWPSPVQGRSSHRPNEGLNRLAPGRGLYEHQGKELFARAGNPRVGGARGSDTRRGPRGGRGSWAGRWWSRRRCSSADRARPEG